MPAGSRSWGSSWRVSRWFRSSRSPRTGRGAPRETWPDRSATASLQGCWRQRVSGRMHSRFSCWPSLVRCWSAGRGSRSRGQGHGSPSRSVPWGLWISWCTCGCRGTRRAGQRARCSRAWRARRSRFQGQPCFSARSPPPRSSSPLISGRCTRRAAPPGSASPEGPSPCAEPQRRSRKRAPYRSLTKRICSPGTTGASSTRAATLASRWRQLPPASRPRIRASRCPPEDAASPCRIRPRASSGPNPRWRPTPPSPLWRARRLRRSSSRRRRSGRASIPSRRSHGQSSQRAASPWLPVTAPSCRRRSRFSPARHRRPCRSIATA